MSVEIRRKINNDANDSNFSTISGEPSNASIFTPLNIRGIPLLPRSQLRMKIIPVFDRQLNTYYNKISIYRINVEN